ncbi:MAG: hypothetical protein ACLUD0_01445 [Eubacterium ramulus]
MTKPGYRVEHVYEDLETARSPTILDGGAVFIESTIIDLSEEIRQICVWVILQKRCWRRHRCSKGRSGRSTDPNVHPKAL